MTSCWRPSTKPKESDDRRAVVSGRKQTPAEVVLRLAVLKHVRNWSFEETEREVRANVVYRQFTRIGAEKFPTPRPWGGWCKRWVRQ